MKRKATQVCYKVYHFEGKDWTPIHTDANHAWVMPFDLRKKLVGGISKKIDLSFLESQQFLICNPQQK